MKTCYRGLVGMILALSMVAVCRAGDEVRSTVLVIPARYTIVQFSSDIASLRPVTVVSYAKSVKSNDILMHVWNDAQRTWTKISVPEYREGSLLGQGARSVVLVGSDSDVPSALLEAPAWSSALKRVTSLNLATLSNTLNEPLQFTPREWKWLGHRYGLELTDLNAERRRWGRYGKPGEPRQAPAPVTPQTDGVTAPRESTEQMSLVVPTSSTTEAEVAAAEEKAPTQAPENK